MKISICQRGRVIRKIAKTPAVVERVQALISDDPTTNRVLMDVVKPWIETVRPEDHVFQQDGTPAHMSHLIQNWLSDNVDMFWSKEFWPPNSPDLNPLDYMWSVVERVLASQCDISLRTAIEAAFVGMDSATLQCACQRFKSRIEAIIQVNGDISNNCVLQGSPKCHVKGFSIIFNFSLKTFCLKKLFDLSGF